MNEGTIVVHKKGSLVPQPLLDKVLLACPTSVGIGYADKEKKEIFFLTESAVRPDKTKTNLAAMVKQFNEAESSKDTFWVMYFSNSPEGEREDDLQPYPILAEGGKTLCVAFLEGFDRHVKPEDPHSGPFHVVKDFLDEFVKEKYVEAEGDLDKMLDLMEKKRSYIRNVLTPRGTITLLTANDKEISFSINDQATKEYDWGWASKSHGYREAEDEPPKKEPNLLELLKAKMKGSAAPATSVPVTAPAKENPPGVHTVPDKPKEEGVYPPPKLKGKDLKKWYEHHRTGGIANLKMWEAGPSFPASELLPNSNLRKGLKSLAELGEHKDKVTQPQGGPPAPPETSLIIFPTMKKEIVDKFVPEILSAEQLKEIFGKSERYADQMGQKDKGLSLSIGWSPNSFRSLCQSHPRAAATLFFDYQMTVLEDRPELLEPVKEEEPAKPDAGGGNLLEKLRAQMQGRKAM